MKLREINVFLGQARSDFFHTGAIFPSSKPLSKSMVSQIQQREEALRILEVGAGTGSFTNEIIPLLRDKDSLDLCEMNPFFAHYLDQKKKTDPVFKEAKCTIRILTSPVQELSSSDDYDHVISGLPLNNFQPEIIHILFDKLFSCLKDDGILSYFEYAFIRSLKAPFVGREERKRLVEIAHVMKGYIQQFEIHSEFVPFNVPPAFTRHLMKTSLNQRGDGEGDPRGYRSS